MPGVPAPLHSGSGPSGGAGCFLGNTGLLPAGWPYAVETRVAMHRVSPRSLSCAVSLFILWRAWRDQIISAFNCWFGRASQSSRDFVRSLTSSQRHSQLRGLADCLSSSSFMHSKPSLMVVASASHPVGASWGGADGIVVTSIVDVDGWAEARPALSAEGAGEWPGNEGRPGEVFAVVLPAVLGEAWEQDWVEPRLLEAAEGPEGRV